MAEFETPTNNRCQRRTPDNPELQTPLKIPATPFLEKIGYGTGVNVFTLERSPKVGCTRSPWALKKRNRNVGETNIYNQRIRFEAEILRKLDHPNVVGFRAYTELSNGEPCLAMEKLDTSLGDILERRMDRSGDPLPAKIILKVSYEVAKGLEYLHHTARILHGDIKSYNVLVSKDYTKAKLCDFGVSAPLTESLEMDRSKGGFDYVGTMHWTAPEILFEDGPVTNKADIWPYGLVIWEMIALSPPPNPEGDDFSEESSMDVSVLDTSSSDDKENHEATTSTNDSIVFLKEMKRNERGVRPPLPAIELGPEYGKVLEIFYACTAERYPMRPNAKDLVEFFRRYVYSEK